MNGKVHDEPSMRQSMAALWRGRWVVFACAGLAGVAGLVYAEKRGVVRRAKATLHVERQGNVIADGDFSRFREGRAFASTQAALLQSSPTLERAIESLGTGVMPMFDGVADRLAHVRRELAVSAGAEDGTLTVTLDAADCATACAVVNAVVDSYAARLGAAQQTAAHTVLAALRDELVQRRNEALAADAEHRRAIEVDPALALDDEARRTAASVRLAELAAAMARVEATAAADAAIMSSARACAEAEDPLLATPFLGMDAAMEARLAERARRVDALQARRERLRATVTDEHPEAVRCDAALSSERADARAAARDMARVAASAAESRAKVAKSNAAAIAQRMREMEQGLVEAAPGVANARVLAARAERARAAAASIEERIHAVELAAAAAQSAAWPQSAMVYERASPASSAVVRGKNSLVAAATFAGLTVGVALVWFRAIARPSAHEARDLDGAAELVIEFPRASRRTSIDAHDRKLSGPAHALAARLQELEGGIRGGALCVLGAVDDQATLAIGAALAVAFTEQGQRVLLCDPFRIGTIASHCDKPAEAAPATESVRASSTPGLWLLVGDEPFRRESQSWDGAAQRAVARVGERFDRVVVLAPALLRAVDAQTMARACGTVALVGRAGDLRVEDARDAAAALRALGIVRSAFVLHGVASKRAAIAAPMRDLCPRADMQKPTTTVPRVSPTTAKPQHGEGAIEASA